MDWKTFVSNSIPEDAETVYETTAPADNQQLDALQKALALEALPPELEELYRQTNGITEVFAGQKIGDLIWSIERVINEYERQEQTGSNGNASFDRLFFFADAGNGDLFGFGVLEKRFVSDQIYAWNHEDGSITLLAPNLKTFLEGWISGRIQI